MGDLLGSPRVAPLLFAVLVEPHFSIHSFFFVPRLQHSARAPPLRVSRRNDAPRVGPTISRRSARARSALAVARNLFSYNCRENNLLPRPHNRCAAEEKNYFFTATKQTCKVLSAFTLPPVASYQINRKSSMPFSGAIIPALKHRIPSELRS